MTKDSESSKRWARPASEKDSNSFIFVHSALDDYGLDVYEFRVLAHVARREGKGKTNKSRGCFARQKTIAESCKMSQRKAQEVLRVLTQAGLLEKKTQIGSTNVYRVAPPSKWQDPRNLTAIRKKSKILEEPELPNELELPVPLEDDEEYF
jgi:hypothetical protein